MMFFFQKLCELVEDIAAVDDRRHGTDVAHMSQWISLSDMIEKATRSCPEGTPIPPKGLVRLQFIPCNPYSRVAQSFTSSVPIQFKISKDSFKHNTLMTTTVQPCLSI